MNQLVENNLTNHIEVDLSTKVQRILSNLKDITKDDLRFLMRPEIAQYLKYENYRALAANLKMKKFFELCYAHGVDPKKYLSSVQRIKNFVSRAILDNYSDFKSIYDDEIRPLFNLLKEKDKLEILARLEEPMFYIKKNGEWAIFDNYYAILELVFGRDRKKKFLNSLSVEKKKAVKQQYPNDFFEFMTAKSIKEVLSS